MAVQAQYPSDIHILKLNRNDAQQGKSPLGDADYAFMKFQQSGGGLFLDHTKNATLPISVPVQHHHTAVPDNNSRKRARDCSTIPKPTTTANLESPLIAMQRGGPNFVDLNHLHNHTPHKLSTNRNFVSTGLGLAFGGQQKHSISPQSSAQSSLMCSLLSDQLGSHIKQQRQEIENFLLAQGEELRRTLAEKKQRHYRTILTAAEETLARRLREKEAEVDKASRRNAELEAKAAQLSLEAQAWQTRAMMQETYAASLQLQLQQGIISGGGGGGGGGHLHGGAQLQDGDEWEGGNSTAVVMGGGEAEDAESAFIDPDRVVVSSQGSCKACRNRVASVVLLPCRHMCLCTECDAVAQACPICLSVRCSSIDVLFS